MIQKIQPFEVPNRGTATETKIEVQSRFTTGDKAVIYYDLRDPNGTTPAFDSRTNQFVTLPYAILSRSLIRVTGEDRDTVVGDEKQAVNIFKRERGDVSVISGIKLALSDSPDKVCGMYINGDVKTYYLDTEDLMSASLLSETEDMKSIVEKEYYVTDGKNIRYWTGKSFDGEYSGICKVKL
jgi:hypothetical protein